MDIINACSKYPEAQTPFGETMISYGNGGVWIECSKKKDSHGFWYKNLREAVKNWRIDLISFSEHANTWIAVPQAARN